MKNALCRSLSDRRRHTAVDQPVGVASSREVRPSPTQSHFNRDKVFNVIQDIVEIGIIAISPRSLGEVDSITPPFSRALICSSVKLRMVA